MLCGAENTEIFCLCTSPDIDSTAEYHATLILYEIWKSKKKLIFVKIYYIFHIKFYWKISKTPLKLGETFFQKFEILGIWSGYGLYCSKRPEVCQSSQKQIFGISGGIQKKKIEFLVRRRMKYSISPKMSGADR